MSDKSYSQILKHQKQVTNENIERPTALILKKVWSKAVLALKAVAADQSYAIDKVRSGEPKYSGDFFRISLHSFMISNSLIMSSWSFSWPVSTCNNDGSDSHLFISDQEVDSLAGLYNMRRSSIMEKIASSDCDSRLARSVYARTMSSTGVLW